MKNNSIIFTLLIWTTQLMAQGVMSASLQSYNEQQLFAKPSKAETRVFNEVTKDALPLTPEQIRTLRLMYNASQRAASGLGHPPKPVSTSKVVDLSPGAEPPVIRLAKGFVSSLVFLDSTGSDWQIQSYDLGNPKAFNIQWDKKSNALVIQASTAYTYGNLAVTLKGSNTPVMLTLIPGQKEVDYRVDLRINKLGPKAKPQTLLSHTPKGISPLLLAILDGIAPESSRLLNVIGGQAQAWLYKNKLYLRTPFNVLSPSFLSKVSSADGMQAYVLPNTPVILVSAYGKPIELQIKGA